MENALKNSRDEIMGHVGELESRVKEVEKSIVAVPKMVQTVAHNMNKSSDELRQVNAKVALNSASMTVLQISVETLEKR